jgi:predicted 3-demethylubiquinone-9 3-methyltransferase (glyoxalase superfamily)
MKTLCRSWLFIHCPSGQLVLRLRFDGFGDQIVLCTDSYMNHDFTFTPSFSLFVQCGSDEEIQRLTSELLKAGSTLMLLDDYGFSRQFAWVNDRYGVSWQLNPE